MGKLILDTHTHTHRIVHVGRLLELSRSTECLSPILASSRIVLGSGNPPNVVFFIVVASFLGFSFGNDLHAVVIDKDICGPSLHLVCGNGGFERHDGGVDDSPETFLVHGHLDCDMWQVVMGDSWRAYAGKELRVRGHLVDWTKNLSQAVDQCLKEEPVWSAYIL